MKRKKIGESILQWLFVNYLTLLDKTMHIEWEEDTQFGDSQIFGFWHEDSFFMNLVLEKLAHRTRPVDVIVTADTRGNYIEHMGRAVRRPRPAGAGRIQGFCRTEEDRTGHL